MRSLLAALTVFALVAPSSAQTTWYVDGSNCTGTGDGSAAAPFCRIQQGIDAASSGDSVVVRAGTYHESVLVPAKALAVRGDGAGEVTILGREYMPALFVSPGGTLLLENLTVTRGSPGMHAIGAQVMLRHCTFFYNFGLTVGWNDLGGAIHATNTSLFIDACEFRDNSTYNSGALYLDGGTCVATDTTFQDNTGWTEVGAITARAECWTFDAVECWATTVATESARSTPARAR